MVSHTRPMPHRVPGSIVTFVVCLLVAAGCGDTEAAAPPAGQASPASSTTVASPPTDPPTTVAEEAPVVLTASDRGVTADAIRVGILLIDVDVIAQLGLDLGFGDVEAHWQVAIDALNQSGGILGRRVEPVFRRYVPVTGAEIEGPCLELVEDREVFVALGFVRTGEAALCFTELHDTPMIFGGAGMGATVRERSVAQAVGVVAAPGALDAAMVAALEAEGALAGSAIAVHGQDVDRVEDTAAAVRALGHEVVAETVETAPETDVIAQDDELDRFAERWRSEGADLVLATSSPVAVTGALARTGVAVDLVTSNAELALDDRGGRGGTAAQFSDARIAVAVTGHMLYAEGHEPTVRCVDRWNAARPDQTADIVSGGGEFQNLFQIVEACAQLDVFRQLAEAAGADLTHESLAEAVATIGSLELAGQSSASLAADKWSVPDLEAIVLMEWDAATGNFVTTEPIPLG